MKIYFRPMALADIELKSKADEKKVNKSANSKVLFAEIFVELCTKVWRQFLIVSDMLRERM